MLPNLTLCHFCLRCSAYVLIIRTQLKTLQFDQQGQHCKCSVVFICVRQFTFYSDDLSLNYKLETNILDSTGQ